MAYKNMKKQHAHVQELHKKEKLDWEIWMSEHDKELNLTRTPKGTRHKVSEFDRFINRIAKIF